jgi:hypothetical protein
MPILRMARLQMLSNNQPTRPHPELSIEWMPQKSISFIQSNQP